MIDQMQALGPKSRRSKQHLPGWDQLEDRCKDVEDVWTRVRGYELFLFHYLRRNREVPLCNHWVTNMGKLIVPDVFVNVKVLEILVRNYKFAGRYI